MRCCVLFFFFFFSRDLKPENILLDDNGKNNNLLQAMSGTTHAHAKHCRQSMMESLRAIFDGVAIFSSDSKVNNTHYIISSPFNQPPSRVDSFHRHICPL